MLDLFLPPLALWSCYIAFGKDIERNYRMKKEMSDADVFRPSVQAMQNMRRGY